ncbi:MAG: hypothetical protein JNM18_15315 [Planctomycetaceae bacterium]|nr:hypothetical protein [Planctomycetaceae bacterium]
MARRTMKIKQPTAIPLQFQCVRVRLPQASEAVQRFTPVLNLTGKVTIVSENAP